MAAYLSFGEGEGGRIVKVDDIIHWLRGKLMESYVAGGIPNIAGIYANQNLS